MPLRNPRSGLRSGKASTEAEALGRGVVAVVDLQPVTGVAAAARIVQAAPGRRVEDGPVGPGHPLLGGAAVAVEQLRRRGVRGSGVAGVQTLAERVQRPVAGRRPALRVAGVAAE